MLDIKRNIFQILALSLKIYLNNFVFLTKPLLYPIIGTISGMVIGIYLPLQYTEYIDENIHLSEQLDHAYFIVLGLFIVLAPGILLLLHAFWKYLILMCSYNRVIYGLCTQEEGMGFHAANEFITKNKKSYLSLLLFFSVLWIIAGSLFGGICIIPLESFTKFVLIGCSSLAILTTLVILSLYWCLSFQIIAFEKLTPFNILKRSFCLVENNLIRAAWLMLIISLITNIIPLLIWLLINRITPLINFLQELLLPFLMYFDKAFSSTAIPYSQFMGILHQFPEQILNSILATTVISSMTAFLLPLGSCVFTLLYTDLVLKKEGKKLEL